MKFIKAIGLVLLLFPIVSVADESGYYVGSAYGVADYRGEKVQDILLESGQRLSDNTNFIQVYGGYQLNDIFSFEVGYTDFSGLSERYYANPLVLSFISPNNIEEIDLIRFSLGGLIEYPVIGNFRVIGLLGYSFFDIDRDMSGGFSPAVGDLSHSSSDSDSGIYYGFGIKYLINSTFSSRLQWVKDNPDDFDFDGSQLSLEMHF